MKKESIFVVIVSTILNLGWSFVFDLLPNLIDYSKLNIKLIRPIYYVVFVIGFILINIFVLFMVRQLLKKTWNKETRIKLIADAINQQIANEVDELPNKPPQFLPGEYRPVFYHYTEAINQLNNLNGWIEFELEYAPPNFNTDLPISLCEVVPGMHQHFMVVLQVYDSEGNLSQSPYCRIRSEPWGISQEYTEDWYNTIFSIISSFSKFISPKMEGPGYDYRTHYVISNYRFLKRGSKHFLRIRVV